MKKLVLMALWIGCLAPGSAMAVVIGFEGLGNGEIVDSQFPEMTFSSNAGFVNKVIVQAGPGSGNNFICTAAPAGAPDCLQETIVVFTSPVNGLSFLQVGDNSIGVVAFVDVFESGALSATVDILGFDTFNTPDLVDLTGFTDVTSIRIHSINDPGGLGWDDFTFNEVPEPSAALLVLSSGLALAVRRFRLRA